MKLEVGMYVRTTTGRTFKIIEVENKNVFYSCNPPELQWQEQTFIHSKRGMECSDNIIKANHNIIDLIEVGDYVNGSKLLSIDYAEDKFGNCDKLHYYYSFEDVDKDVNEYYEKLVIKSIVTKEMYSSVEYRVESN